MRTIATSLLVLVLASGCSLLDEIEDPYPDGRPEAETAAAAPAPAGETPEDRRAAWWKSARTLGPADTGGDNPMVSCSLAGKTRFMHRNDCLSQGGRPSS